MKQIIIFAILLLSTLYLVQGEACNDIYLSLSCGGFNATCGYNATSSQNLVCQSGYYCSNPTKVEYGTCQEIVGLGDACAEDEQCGDIYDCESGKCTESNYATMGEECEFDYQCYSKLVCSMTTKTCTNSTAKCENDNDCPFDQYCKGEVCNVATPLGEQCDTDDQCGTWAICEKLANGTRVCTAPYSLAEGATCTDGSNSYTSCDVSDGLLCKKEICTRINPDAEQPTSADFQCNSTSTAKTCQAFETCYCTSQGDGGRCYQKDPTDGQQLNCAQATKSLVECLNANKCYQVVSPSSCLYSHCASEYCDKKSECALPSVREQVEGCENIDNDICTLLGASSTIVAPMLTVVFVAIISIFFL